MRIFSGTGQHRAPNQTAVLRQRVEQQDRLIERLRDELAAERAKTPDTVVIAITTFVPVRVPASHEPHHELTATSIPRQPALAA